MPTYFLDSSAVVKYYVSEPGTAFVRRIVEEENSFCFVANITLAEVAAAFAQLQRNGPYGKAFVSVLTPYLYKRCSNDNLLLTLSMRQPSP